MTYENTTLFAALNKTKAASDFLARLPLTITGVSSDEEYYSFSIPRGCYDPTETQIGWKDGDLCLCDDCFAIPYSGEEKSEHCGDIMVIGQLDNPSLEAIRKLPKRITLLITTE